ncbi:MAG: hypothetical protein IJB14_02870, partial [Firmicutes bacterium]|nr:hypothetical protein [Bacillota bacterium]
KKHLLTLSTPCSEKEVLSKVREAATAHHQAEIRISVRVKSLQRRRKLSIRHRMHSRAATGLSTASTSTNWKSI